jgi:predicted enzyme related to lactoylglutathione lyase
MCALFVDFRAAFDNVKVNGLFEATKGKGQVCPRSPLLFTIYVADIDEMLKKAQAGGSVVGREKVSSLAFAGDLVICSSKD